MSFETSQPIRHCYQNTDIIVEEQQVAGRPHSDPTRKLVSRLPPTPRCRGSYSFGLHPGSVLVPVQCDPRWIMSILSSSGFIDANLFGAEFT